VDLKQEIQLSPAEFNQKFRHSAIKRTKRKGYLRNLAVALGNTRNPAFIDTIAQVLQTETEPLIRAHLVWALGNIGTGKAKGILLQLQGSEKDTQVKSEIDHALTKYSDIK
jgi:epoxyqueuosine reductase